MELLKNNKRNALLAVALSVGALASCSIDSYSNDPSDVQCNGERTITDLNGDGMATFIVHGKDESTATVQIRRIRNNVSVAVTGDLSAAPHQKLQDDGFTTPVPLVDGPELSAFGAGGSWIIDARKDSIVIQGSCNGQ